MTNKIEEVKKIIESYHLHTIRVFDKDPNFRMQHKDALLEELADQICQLFEPKPDEELLLTGEEHGRAVAGIPLGSGLAMVTREKFLLKAQLAKAQAHYEKRVRKIFEGLELKNPYTTEYKYQCSMDANMPQNLIVNDDAYTAWEECRLAMRQALKAGKGEG